MNLPFWIKNASVVLGVRGPEVKYGAAGQSSQSVQVEVLQKNNKHKCYCLSCNALICISEVFPETFIIFFLVHFDAWLNIRRPAGPVK